MRISRRRVSHAAVLAGALALPNVTSAIGVAFTPQFLAGRFAGREELERYLARQPNGRVGRLLRPGQRLIEPALVVLAGAPVSAAAGALGVGTLRFLAWSTLGAVLPTLLLVVVGSTAAEPVRWVSNVLSEHVAIWWGFLAVVCVGLAVTYGVRHRRTMRRGGTNASEPADGPAGDSPIRNRSASET